MAMDEAQITAKAQPEVISERDPNTPELGHVVGRPWLPLYEHFQVKDDGTKDKSFEQIWSWATEKAGSQNKDLVVLEIIKLANKLGTPNLGDARYSKVLNYITVSRQLEKAAQTLKEMERVA